jgi:hypothetical protein
MTIYIHLSQDSGCPDRGSNRPPSANKSEELPPSRQSVQLHVWDREHKLCSIPCLTYSSTLKIEVGRSSETAVPFNQTADDGTLETHITLVRNPVKIGLLEHWYLDVITLTLQRETVRRHLSRNIRNSTIFLSLSSQILDNTWIRPRPLPLSLFQFVSHIRIILPFDDTESSYWQRGKIT